MEVLTSNQVIESKWRKANCIWICLIVSCATVQFHSPAFAQNAFWVWNGQHEVNDVPTGTTHYRKSFELTRPQQGELVIAADDEYQIYLNDELVGYGGGYDELTKVVLTPNLRDGSNHLAVRATNTTGSTGALAVVLRFQLEGETVWRWLATDESWKSSITVAPDWKNAAFDDSAWSPVRILGPFGTTQPWDSARLGSSDSKKAENNSDGNERDFRVPRNFQVQRILDESVGSLVAMAFNEFGQIILSREGGKLLLADLSKSEKGEITVRKYCDAIDNVQGILPLNGDVFVTGVGPQGLGLYRLTDGNQDGLLEPFQMLMGFKGEPGEHGPHGLALGPEGMIYVTIGNASSPTQELDATSPASKIYEGVLLPRMEDPGGHAVGVKAPGGTIVRISVDGRRKEVFATGIRNAYDLAFNRAGELFVHDSDMESDEGTPWYRPTQIYHVTAGGEYGWRSGSAKFPYYYADNLPGIGDTGRGSPSGAVIYNHFMMPLRYHGALFLGDWSEGRILVAHLKQSGDTYQTEIEEFLSAQPLTVTDIAVGPDGALYFCTGGRGTEGGLYRVSWNGTVPDSFSKLTDPLSQLVRRPQPQSAWSRQQTAKIKVLFEDQWGNMLRGILSEQRNDPNHRMRAMETLLLYGPLPTNQFLITLAQDSDPNLRTRAIDALSWRSGDQIAVTIAEALDDGDPRVRRAACSALSRTSFHPNWEMIVPLLKSEHRSESFAARRLLESIDPEVWRDKALTSQDIRVFVHGAIALMIVEPTLKNAYDVLARSSEIMDGDIVDRDYLDLLRVMQLALLRGNVKPTDIPKYSERIAEEFPAANGDINREISHIIGYLKTPLANERLPHYLENSIDTDLDKLQVLVNLRHLVDQMDAAHCLSAIKFLERVQSRTETGNYSVYVSNLLEQFTNRIDKSQITEIIRNGHQWPTAALAVFYQLPDQLEADQIELIIQMDKKLAGRLDNAAIRARVGCVAVLARSGDDDAMYYLREVWRHEPERRNNVVLGLAQKPGGPNWPYLVSSLDQLNDDTASEVLIQLSTVNRRPREPKFYRQVITVGYRLRQEGTQAANKLLRHWTDQEVVAEDGGWQAVMKAWSKWFSKRFPDEAPIGFEDEITDGKYSVDQLLTFIERASTTDLHSGMMLYNQAQCAQCHRFGGQGEALGPDLSTVQRRFSRRELLRSILYPSEHISDQYQSKKVLTNDGRLLTGLLTKVDDDNFVLLTSEGKKIQLMQDEVEQIESFEKSSMPDGLVDTLSMQDIHDLVSYLYSHDQQVAQKSGNAR